MLFSDDLFGSGGDFSVCTVCIGDIFANDFTGHLCGEGVILLALLTGNGDSSGHFIGGDKSFANVSDGFDGGEFARDLHMTVGDISE